MFYKLKRNRIITKTVIFFVFLGLVSSIFINGKFTIKSSAADIDNFPKRLAININQIKNGDTVIIGDYEFLVLDNKKTNMKDTNGEYIDGMFVIQKYVTPLLNLYSDNGLVQFIDSSIDVTYDARKQYYTRAGRQVESTGDIKYEIANLYNYSSLQSAYEYWYKQNMLDYDKFVLSTSVSENTRYGKEEFYNDGFGRLFYGYATNDPDYEFMTIENEKAFPISALELEKYFSIVEDTDAYIYDIVNKEVTTNKGAYLTRTPCTSTSRNESGKYIAYNNGNSRIMECSVYEKTYLRPCLNLDLSDAKIYGTEKDGYFKLDKGDAKETRFYDFDGEFIQKYSAYEIANIEELNYPNTKYPELENQNGYIFMGWDSVVSNSGKTEDMYPVFIKSTSGTVDNYKLELHNKSGLVLKDIVSYKDLTGETMYQFQKGLPTASGHFEIELDIDYRGSNRCIINIYREPGNRDILIFESSSPFNISFKTEGNWNGTIEYLKGDTNYRETSGVWNVLSKQSATEKISAEKFADKYYLSFRGYNNTKINTNFVIVAKANDIKVSGDVGALLNYKYFKNKQELKGSENCFNSLFYGCEAIKDCSNLVIPSLSTNDKYAYYQMFKQCTNLLVLKKTTLYNMEDYKYASMFESCVNLVIPSIDIQYGRPASYACYMMYENCKKLARTCSIRGGGKSSKLSLYSDDVKYTLSRMFKDCENIKSPLPALNYYLSYGCHDYLVKNMFYDMFNGCHMPIFDCNTYKVYDKYYLGKDFYTYNYEIKDNRNYNGKVFKHFYVSDYMYDFDADPAIMKRWINGIFRGNEQYIDTNNDTVNINQKFTNTDITRSSDNDFYFYQDFNFGAQPIDSRYAYYSYESTYFGCIDDGISVSYEDATYEYNGSQRSLNAVTTPKNNYSVIYSLVEDGGTPNSTINQHNFSKYVTDVSQLKFKNVGTYCIAFALVGNNQDYHFPEKNIYYVGYYYLTIKPSTLSISYPQSVDYDGNEHKAELTVTSPSGGSKNYKVYYLNEENKYVEEPPRYTDPGHYVVNYKISGDINYEYEAGSFEYVINRLKNSDDTSVEGSVKATGYTGVYDGKYHSGEIKVGQKIKNPKIYYKNSKDGVYYKTPPTIKNVGSRTIYYLVESDTHTDFTGEFTLKVTKATPRVMSHDKIVDYDGAFHDITPVDVSNVLDSYYVYYKGPGDTNYSMKIPSFREPDNNGYEIYYKVVSSDNYEEVEGKFKFTIASGKIIANALDHELTYDGLSHQFKLVDVTKPEMNSCKIYYKTTENGTYTETNPTFKNANEDGYKIWWKVTTDGYEEITGFSTILIHKASMKDITVSNNQVTYNGSEQAPTIKLNQQLDGFNPTIRYSLTKGNYTLSQVPTFTKVSTNTIYYRLTRTNFTDLEGSFNFTINKGSMSNPTITNTTFTYDGKEHKAIFTPPTLINSGSVKVTYGTTSGTYNLNTIPSIVNYTTGTTIYYKMENDNYNQKTGSFKYVVNKAQMPEAIIEHDTHGYDGTAKKANVKVFLADGSSPKITYSLNNNTFGNHPSCINTGTYKIYYKLENSNYITKIDSYNLTITEGEINEGDDKIGYEKKGYSGIYDGDTHYPTITLGKGISGALVEYSENENGPFTTNKIGITNAGNKRVWFKITAQNFAPKVDYVDLYLDKADIEYTVNTYKGKVDGNRHGIEVNVSNPASAIIRYGLRADDINLYQSPTYMEGTYEIWYKIYSEDGNYNEVIGSEILRMSTKPLSYTISGYKGIYDGNEHGPTIDILSSDVSASDIVYSFGTKKGEYTQSTPIKYTDAGNYLVYVKISAGDYDDIEDSYVINIDKASIIPQLPSVRSFEYDGNYKDISVKAANIADGNYSVAYGVTVNNQRTSYNEMPKLVDVGTYSIDYVISSNLNYISYSGNFIVTITPTNIPINDLDYSITPIGYEGVYDGLTHYGSVELGAGLEGATVEYSSSQYGYYSANPIGVKNVTNSQIWYRIIHKNFNLYYGTINLIITKADITVEEPPVKELQFNNQYNNMGISVYTLNNDNYSVTYTINGIYQGVTPPSLKDAKTYNIDYIVSAGTNYNQSTGSYTVIINPIELPVFQLGYNVSATSYKGVFDGYTHYGKVQLGNNISTALVEYKDLEEGDYTSNNIGITSVGRKIIHYRVTYPNYIPYENIFTLEVEKAKITVEEPTVKQGTYNNTYYSPVVSVKNIQSGLYTIKYRVNGEGEFTTGAPRIKEIGTYNIEYQVSAGENYEDVLGSFEYSIVMQKLPTNDTRYKVEGRGYQGTYDGEVHYGEVRKGSLIASATVEYKDGEQGEYQSDNIGIRDVGTKKIYYRVTYANYEPIEGSFTLEVKPSTILVEIPSLREVEYTGLEYTTSVSVKNISQGNYVVKYRINEQGEFTENIPVLKDAGNYKIEYEVTAGDNYVKATGTYTFKIVSVYIPVDRPGYEITPVGYNGVYDGQIHYADVILGENIKDAVVEFKEGQTGTYSSSKIGIIDYGSKSVYYKVSIPNYLSIEGNIILSIDKATIQVREPESTYVEYNGEFYDASVTVLNVSTPYTVTYSIDGSPYTTNPPLFKDEKRYIVQYKVNAGDNYKAASGGFIFQISTARLPLDDPNYSIVAIGYKGEYDRAYHQGELQLGSALATAEVEYKDGINGTYSSSQVSIKDVGTKEVYYKITYLNYQPVEGSFTLEVTPAKINVTKPVHLSVPYDNTYHSPTVTLTDELDEGAVILYRVNGQGMFTANEPSLINAGDYTIEYSINAGDNYESTTGSFNYNIMPIDIPLSSPGYEIIAHGYSGVYDGQTHYGSLELGYYLQNAKVEFKESEHGTYTTNNIGITNAGTKIVYYKITYPNHNPVEDSFVLEVTKAPIEVIEPEEKDVAYTGKYYSAGVSVNNTLATNYSITYRVNGIGGFTFEVPRFSEIGDYYVEYRVNAGEDFEFVQGAYVFSITVKSIPENDPDYSIQPVGYKGVYDNDIHYGSLTLGNKIKNGLVEYKDGENGIYSTSNVGIRDVGTKQVFYRITLSPYNPIEGSFTLEVTKSTITVSLPSQREVSYNGNYYNAGVSVTNISAGQYQVYYRINNQGAFASNTPSFKDAGSYTVEYQVNAVNNYENTSGAYEFKINKINIPVTQPGYEINASSYLGEYDGQIHYGKVICGDNLSGAVIEYKSGMYGTYSTSEIGIINYGKEEVYYRVTSPNFNTYEGKFTLEVTKANIEVEEPLVKNVSYNSSYYDAGVIVKNVTIGSYVVLYRIDGQGDYTSDTPRFKDSGSYVVEYKIMAGDNYIPYNSVYIFKITKQTLPEGQGYSIKADGYKGEYDGQVHYGKITLGSSLSNAYIEYKEGEDGTYGTSNIGIINVGKKEIYYKITYSTYDPIIGSFTLEVTKTNIVVNEPQEKTVKYKGAYYDAGVTISNISSSSYQILYRVGGQGEFNSTVPRFKDTGNYYVEYQVSAGENYISKNGNYYFRIDTVDFPTDDINFTIYAQGYSGVYDGNIHYGNVYLGSSIKDAVVEYKDSTMADYSTEQIGIIDYGTKTISYKVSYPNYNVKYGTFTLEIKKAPIEVTVPINNIVEYSGSEIETKISVKSPEEGMCNILYRVNETGIFTNTIPKFIDVGTYKIEYQVTAGDNYESVSGSYNFTILPIDFPSSDIRYSIDAIGYSGDYDKTTHYGKVLLGTAISDAKVEYKVEGGEYSENNIGITDVGEETIYYKVTYPNYNPKTGSFTLKVNPIRMRLQVESYQGKYDGNKHGIVITVDEPLDAQIRYGERADDINSKYSPEYINEGTYPVYYRVTHKNYIEETGVANVQISRNDPIKYRVDSFNGEYDGNPHGISVVIRNENIPEGDIEILYGTEDGVYDLYESPTFVDYGVYKVYVKIKAVGYDDTTFDVDVNINKSNIIVREENITKTYNGQIQSPKLQIISPDESICIVKYRTSSDEEYSTVAPAFVNAGTYNIDYLVEAGDNYNIKEGSIKFIINNAKMNTASQGGENLVESSGYEDVYDGFMHSGEVRVNSKILGYNITYSKSSINGPWQSDAIFETDVCESVIYYKVSAPNYDDEKGSFRITIRPAKLEYEVDAYNGSYDGLSHGVTIKMIKPSKDEAAIKFGEDSAKILLDESPMYSTIGSYMVYYSITAKNYESVSEGVLVRIKDDSLHSVTYVQYDGTSSKQEKVLNEKEINPPSVKSVEDYVFIGWLGDTSLITEEDITLKAIYLRTNNIINIKDDVSIDTNYDGENIKFEYRLAIDREYEEGLPNKEGEYKVRAIIDEPGIWNNNNVDLTIEVKKYVVTFYRYDGTEYFVQNGVSTKSQIADIPGPEETNYKFAGWYGKDFIKEYLECDIMLVSMYLEIPPKELKVGEKVELETNIGGATLTYIYVDPVTGEESTTPPSKDGEYIVKVKATGDMPDVGIDTGSDELYEEEFVVTFKDKKGGGGGDPLPNIPIYRLYNRTSGEHLFTTRRGEYDKLGKSGWVQEGKAFDAYAEDKRPDNALAIYRLYNKNGLGGIGDHHYTKSESEVNKLKNLGWTVDFEGKPAFYVYGQIAVYKMYNEKVGTHHYTPKLGEKNNMIKIGWIEEGVAWYVNAYYNNNGDRVTE